MEVKCKKCGGEIKESLKIELLLKMFGNIGMMHEKCIKEKPKNYPIKSITLTEFKRHYGDPKTYAQRVLKSNPTESEFNSIKKQS